MTSNNVTIRPASTDDAAVIIDVRRTAIHEKAGSHYDQKVIALWADEGIQEERIDILKQQISEGEWFTLVAVAENAIIGYGQVSVKNRALGAVYVRKNKHGPVGRQILQHLIAHAKENKAQYLEMDSSTNAEAFYKAAGFEIVSYGKHIMGPSGIEMACAKMRLILS